MNLARKVKTAALCAAVAVATALGAAPREARAASAQPVAPCVTVTTTQSGVTQEFCVPVTAAQQLPVKPIYLYVSAGASQMALAVGTNTTLTVPTGATIAQICVETAGVRYRDDGTAATASLGIPVSAGTCFAYSGPLSALSFTAQSGSPTIDVSYYHAN